jgi:NADH dehydrogenase (ubiquinone) 1 alpha subcomplex subunit 5
MFARFALRTGARTSAVAGARAALFARSVNTKATTGIAGMPVVPNAREVLLSLYGKTLDVCHSYPEEHMSYNKHIIKLTEHRKGVVESTEDIQAIEDRIMCGQVEELIEQAEDELELLYAMNDEYKPWEADPEGDAEFAQWHPNFGEDENGDWIGPEEAKITEHDIAMYEHEVWGGPDPNAAKAEDPAQIEAAA